MTCHECEDLGLVSYLPAGSDATDVSAKFEDLHFAVCLCPAGQRFRLDTNEGHKVAPMWRVWCARHQVHPSRVRLVEQVFSADELKAAGFTKSPADFNREAAMLAAGKRKSRQAQERSTR